MAIGYRVDMAAVNGAAAVQAVRLREWVNGALVLQSELAKLGEDFAAQATVLVGLGFTQEEADAMVYEIGAMHEAALVLSGVMPKLEAFNYVDATANLTGFGRQA